MEQQPTSDGAIGVTSSCTDGSDRRVDIDPLERFLLCPQEKETQRHGCSDTSNCLENENDHVISIIELIKARYNLQVKKNTVLNCLNKIYQYL